MDSKGNAWIQEERLDRAGNRWIALSNIRKYPSGPVASVSLTIADGRLHISLLTTNDKVYEASCPTDRGRLSEEFLHRKCSPFVSVATRKSDFA
ncbi:hypothetical protein ACWCQN_43730 [Streptomyces sp. NPDC001984]|uniref:hypothetical protein n=1 Tax=Streptomyces sp. NPDC002619 TaxID=3364655 RepID=UPI003683AD45